MDRIILIICLAAMIISTGWAVMVRSTIKSAVALAIVSVALSIIMYELGSVWAALFELSVCSGFVTVIFISAVSMTSSVKEEQDKIYEQHEHTVWLPVVLILARVILIAVMLATGFKLPYPDTASAAASDFRTTLWVEHKGLLWAQVIVLLAGAFAVIVLFRGDRKK